MKLCRLVENIPQVEIIGDDSLEINGITVDSRKCFSGSLFAAFAGTNLNGEDYIPSAIESGAVAVLSERPLGLGTVTEIVAKNPRLAFSLMAENFYNNPSDKLNLIGITGTNGKTTTAYILRHILAYNNQKCGMIGTVCTHDGDRESEASMTTPDSEGFSKLLSQMVENGCTAAVAEVSSHALSQYRVGGCKFDAGIFTNLTRDHLDYHNTMEEYASAKSLLFKHLPESGSAIVNADDPYGNSVSADCLCGVFTYGADKSCTMSYKVNSISFDGSEVELTYNGETIIVKTVLSGLHNIYNICAAALCALKVGVDFNGVAEAVGSFSGVPGRLQRVENGLGLGIFVDYAHTNDALENVLSALDALKKKKIIVVFGCGGDRDRGKRPLMAKIAEKYADIVIVTDDNPRTENSEQIFADIKSGFNLPDIVCFEHDREKAVLLAVQKASKGDIILIAGKGHETYQVIGTETRHLDDCELVKFALDKTSC
jgi:UDP-N-acetylmuramoyl-L-alanyl-D-glutamate--2,6-diaminopimelate ligase